MEIIKKTLGLGEVFVDVGTNDEIELAEGREVVGINVELLEGMMRDPIEDVFVFVGKGNNATFVEEFVAKNAVTTAEVDGVDRGSHGNAIFFLTNR